MKLQQLNVLIAVADEGGIGTAARRLHSGPRASDACLRARIDRVDAMTALHDTNGHWNLLAELRAQSLADLSLVLERVWLIKGIASTETSVLLASFR
jgi:hypothetical protein